MLPVLVYYHAYLTSSWRELVTEQLERLRRAEIPAPFASLAIGAEPARIAYRELVDSILKVAWHLDQLETGNQCHSINHLRAMVDQVGDGAVLYFHTKGITHPDKCSRDWRRLMEYFCLDRWQDALAALDRGADAVGCDYSETVLGPHFSGTFWWAATRHLHRLPQIPQDNPFAAEAWIGRDQAKLVSLHQSGLDHYQSLYPEERYLQVSR
jgi:hypothetical protein